MQNPTSPHSAACSPASATGVAAGSSGTWLPKLGDKILQGHALWSYFRNKLALRYSPNLYRYLLAADEFAWACHEPLHTARAAAGTGSTSKVPPLLYLGRDVSPFVYPRDWSLENQIPDVTDTVFASLIEHAPVSVISLPFYQTTHLPETMVLAHEMGHVVEMDLQLSAALDRVLAELPEETLCADHRQTWQRCRVEAFADLFGAAAGGIAFCHALVDFLADDRYGIRYERIDDQCTHAYPTRYLRVLLVLEVLRSRDNGTLPPAAAALEQQWRSRYGNDHAHRDYEKDLAPIVGHLLDTPLPELGTHSIRDLAGLAAEDDTEAAQEASRMLTLKATPQLGDPRTLFSAAAQAFYLDPQGYETQRVEDLVLDRIRRIADMAPRRDVHLAEETKLLDRQAGATIAGLLGS